MRAQCLACTVTAKATTRQRLPNEHVYPKLTENSAQTLQDCWKTGMSGLRWRNRRRNRGDAIRFYTNRRLLPAICHQPICLIPMNQCAAMKRSMVMPTAGLPPHRFPLKGMQTGLLMVIEHTHSQKNGKSPSPHTREVMGILRRNSGTRKRVKLVGLTDIQEKMGRCRS